MHLNKSITIANSLKFPNCKLFEVPIDQILIPATVKLHTFGEQQAEPCCSSLLNPLLLYYIICQVSCH